MERVRLSKRRFKYRPRNPAALLTRIGNPPTKRPRKTKAKLFSYVTPEERAHQRDMRKRKKLGVQHDTLVPADRVFTICLSRIVNAPSDLLKWRKNMNRYWTVVLADQGPRK